jgi:hypothetical protein
MRAEQDDTGRVENSLVYRFVVWLILHNFVNVIWQEQKEIDPT